MPKFHPAALVPFELLNVILLLYVSRFFQFCQYEFLIRAVDFIDVFPSAEPISQLWAVLELSLVAVVIYLCFFWLKAHLFAFSVVHYDFIIQAYQTGMTVLGEEAISDED